MSTQSEAFQPPRYRAYLIRLWQEHPQRSWRASAQAVQSGDKRYFSDLHELFAFLQGQTETAAGDEKVSSPGVECAETRGQDSHVA
ncbi:MAG: hypothetical protein U0175_07900 [Caldilineaceae bacterium]